MATLAGPQRRQESIEQLHARGRRVRLLILALIAVLIILLTMCLLGMLLGAQMWLIGSLDRDLEEVKQQARAWPMLARIIPVMFNPQNREERPAGYQPAETSWPAPEPPSETFFVSVGHDLPYNLGSAGEVGAEDILSFDGTDFTMIFDGSDLGLEDLNLDAFFIVDANTLLLSFDKAATIGPLGLVDDADIIRFDAISLGQTTIGSFSLFLDGSAVGLTTSGEDVDAISLLPDGRLLLSTTGTFRDGGIRGQDEDLLLFTPANPGDYLSQGRWQLYFDGSDLGLGPANSHEVSGVAVNAAGDIYLTTTGGLDTAALSNAMGTIFRCHAPNAGDNTACHDISALTFSGNLWALVSSDLDALGLPPALTGQPSLNLANRPSSPEPAATPVSAESSVFSSIVFDIQTPTPTNSPTPTGTLTPTPTGTPTPTPTPSPTLDPSGTPTLDPSGTPTPTSTPTWTPTATPTATPTGTLTPEPTSTPTATPKPTSTPTPRPTNTFTPLPTSTFTPAPTNTFTPAPTNTFTPAPTNTFTPAPTNTPTPVPDVINVTRAEFIANKNEWRIEGTSSIAGPGNTMTIYRGPNPNGAVIGTAQVDAAGQWAFRQRDSSVSPDGTNTISVKSTFGGTVKAVPVTIK